MVDKVTLISKKASNCFAWSPEQMLEEFLKAIRSGEEMPKGMIITYSVEDPKTKRINVYTWRAQLNWTEEYAFLHIAQNKCLEHQQGD